uniref:CCDC7 n=1 Tax=Cricetulus griseus TaxID=10029 RepID=A0A8C2M7L7_CRIGR
MKRAKQLPSVSKKLANVPELPYKKGLLNSPPKSKEKHNAKAQHDKIEPMVLRSPPTGESIVRYALPIPSSKTKDLITEDEVVKRIAKHLKMILESLFMWFQQQVNQMEEISRDQSNFEEDLPSDDKTVDLNISQIANLVHKFEELKNRLKEQRGSLGTKHMDKDIVSETMKSFEAIEKQIEEFIKSHPEFESQFVSEVESGTPYSLTDRMSIMIKIFENQTTMLERALNDQSIIETKYKQMETDFQVLLLEKTLLESEIQKMKVPEKAKPTGKDERTKKPPRPERKKESERRLSPSGETELAEIQEAERNKNQLEFVLHHETELYKEDRSKTKMEGAFSRTGEDSRPSDYDQMSPDKSERSK